MHGESVALDDHTLRQGRLQRCLRCLYFQRISKWEQCVGLNFTDRISKEPLLVAFLAERALECRPRLNFQSLRRVGLLKCVVISDFPLPST